MIQLRHEGQLKLHRFPQCILKQDLGADNFVDEFNGDKFRLPFCSEPAKPL